MTETMRLAVALDGAGWHPAAWREPDARPDQLLSAGYWTDLVQEAERGLLDLVTIDDSLALQSSSRTEQDERVDQVRGRLDALQVAARVAPVTRHIGLIPTVVVTHTEPFHAATTVATLDYVSTGRAGVQIRVSARPDEAALFGRRTIPPFRPAELDTPGGARAELFTEAEDYVEVMRRLWDSWEDDAVIRDVTTGRFVDRAKLHYIDFTGAQFAVRGPSITPRPPQGQPLVSALAHRAVPFALVGRSADIGFVTPRDAEHAGDVLAQIRAAQDTAGRVDDTVHVFGDMVVFLDDEPAVATERKARLDELAGSPFTSDAQIFTGTPAQLADLAQDWQRAGLSGLRLRPATLPHDLRQITRALVPELQRRGAFRTEYPADTLRGLLGLPRPANRYAEGATR